MKLKVDDMINNALPYFIGGALLYWAYKHFIGTSYTAVKEKSIAMSVKWGFLSEDEKKAYLFQAANFINDATWNTLFSYYRDTSEVRDFIHRNRFCLLELGKVFLSVSSAPFWGNNTLSLTINGRLNPKDYILLDYEYSLLVENGL